MKKIDNRIPFYSNTPDNTHCFQACLRMLIEHYWPEEKYSWVELDKITQKIENLWSWPMAGLLWMKKKGLEVRNIEIFDYARFEQLGEKYLTEIYGEEVVIEQTKNADIEQGRVLAGRFVHEVEVEKRIPSIDELKKMIEAGFLVIVGINARVLEDKTGYAGHFVVIKGLDENGFILNDPGLPAQKNKRVSYELFNKAWAYPAENAKDIMAFRLPG